MPARGSILEFEDPGGGPRSKGMRVSAPGSLARAVPQHGRRGVETIDMDESMAPWLGAVSLHASRDTRLNAISP